jgi:hypothetical protein
MQVKSFDWLTGRKINGLSMVGDELHLSIDEGWVALLIPEGECCSLTWIESVDLIDPLIGGTIRSVQNIDMPDRGDIGTLRKPIVECVKYYGLRIETDKGVSVIDYRNDSNGYYGGRLLLYIERVGKYAQTHPKP